MSLTPSELVSKRWFRSKHRPVSALTEIDRAWIDRRSALAVVEVAYADGGASDRYLLPLVDGHEPRDGEGAWSGLVRAMAGDADLRGATGRFVCRATATLERLLPSARENAGALTEQRLAVEQSNTSVRLGDRLIMKLYRLLEPGENPDLEVPIFLTDVGFADAPPVAGSIHWVPDSGQRAAAVALQAFVPSVGDAWNAMLRTLAEEPGTGLEQATRIGAVTAAMHAALASRPDHPAFPARAATNAETAGWRVSAEGQLAQAVGAVAGSAHERLVRLAPSVRARFADTFGAASGEATVSRIHGDYHLGQLLARPDGGYSVIDFEGEPARPLAERRAPSSPLRDVAGLLRSLDYAARTTAARDPAFDADAWLDAARVAFLAAYGVADEDAPLLAAFELEKACYEVRYEASNRPDWAWLPLAAVERLVS